MEVEGWCRRNSFWHPRLEKVCAVPCMHDVILGVLVPGSLASKYRTRYQYLVPCNVQVGYVGEFLLPLQLFPLLFLSSLLSYV
jgi:hypothetical protein